MNAFSVESRKEDKFKRRLQRIVIEEDLAMQRDLIQRTAAELDIDLLSCAAALVYLSQPNLYPALKQQPKLLVPLPQSRGSHPGFKMVRYRLAVGSQHQISREDIQAVLIEESGVDKKRIGRIDIRDTHTLVELPDGMPADIFQLLTEVAIGPHRLNIKRVKPNKFRQTTRTIQEEESE
ncbi:Cold-shock DEAD-box protein A [Methylomonas albis]|uniref:DbpA RNA binding domain-containing protein n=1 Tax=Methylomonas albis TaxID=1854563 RepID=A0ABR9D470_9GAMM|nr:DbpA RNA binding domain-containing protein [Methylomonas albis]MBD9357576.1 DbpA RNA binding domain-containing protein [Methylomonas albis]CAD6880874.1 Cold-shock DEAD-box protein A [Methylomonas albis]